MNSSTNSNSTSTYYNEYKERMKVHQVQNDIQKINTQNTQNELQQLNQIYQKQTKEKEYLIKEYKQLLLKHKEVSNTLSKTKNNYEEIKQKNFYAKQIIIKQIIKP